MSIEEVRELPGMYARGAAYAKDAGFTGVHVHAGHGFLLNQFLSPLFNRRNDAYGGSIEARCDIVATIINEVRRAVGPSFPIGVRINATDKLEGGLTEDDALEVVRRAKAETDVPLMLTGGFERRDQAVDAIAGGTVDMVGLARAMVLNPRLADTWLTEEGGDPDFPVFNSPPRGGVTSWYSMRLTALGEDGEDAFVLDPQSALRLYEERDAQRCIKWREKFPAAPNSRVQP